MSNTITNLCRGLVMSPPQKAVLMCLADHADDSGIAWPSVPAICAWTCLGRTAVIAARNHLESKGYLKADRSIGRNSRIAFDLEALESVNQSASRTSPGGEPVRDANHHPSASRTTPVHDANHTSSPREPNTPIHQLTIIEPPGKKVLSIPGIPDQLLADYMAVRKAKKGGPLTGTVVAGIQREAALAGITLEQAMTFCCEQGWRGFKASWYAKAAGDSATTDRRSRQLETAALMTGAKPAARPMGVARDFTDVDYREGIDAHGHLLTN